MAHVALNHAPIMNAETGRRAAIWRCSQTGEYVVKFYRAVNESFAPRWQYLGEYADHFTNDKADAYDTAAFYVK